MDFNIALRMVFHPHDAEEVTQEVLVKAITPLSTFQGESQFRTWLYRITANHVLNMKRRGGEVEAQTFSSYADAINDTPDLDMPDPNTVAVDVPLLVEEAKISCTTGMLRCLDRKQRLIGGRRCSRSDARPVQSRIRLPGMGCKRMDARLWDYLQRILTARVYDVAIETPLERAAKLSARLGTPLWLKREDTQPVFSFKLRGAYNMMSRLPPDQLARGVICASAGNHAQGVALSAQRLGCRAVVVMPFTTPLLKSDAVRGFGAEVVLHGDSYSDAYVRAVELGTADDLTFVHPFDDPDVIAGQGTVGMEILRQHQAPLHAVFVSVGGGGLLAGVAAYIKAVRPEVKVIGVQMADSDAMLRSVRAGDRVRLDDVGLFSDGTAVKQVGVETLRLVRDLADGFVVVDTDAVCAAIKDVFEDTRTVLEPAGAMGVAGAKQYAVENRLRDEPLVAITCGANMNFDRLRFVAERAEAGEGREALFAVTIPEKRGSFRRLCDAVGRRNVTEFNYRISDERVAHVFVGLAVASREEVAAIGRAFVDAGFEALDMTGDDLSKDHVRHMVGGPSPLARGERLYRFQFPERPGALVKFLSSMHPDWNISLFHYRNQGADYGRILVGVQTPDADAFQAFARGLGYPWVDETENPVYRLFLR